MPDPYQIPGFIPADITADTSAIPGFIPTPQPSQGMSWTETAIRTVPAVAGGVLGSAFGIPGAMAGGALGSAIGDIGGQWYSGQEFNPYELGVETALGGLPPIFGAGKVAAPGIRGLINYGVKQAGINAVEGALVSGAATPFQHAAQTGSFNAPAESYLSNAAGGAILGGGLGGVLGGYQGHLQQLGQAPSIARPTVPDPYGQMPTGLLEGVPAGPPPVAPTWSYTPPIRSMQEGPYTDFLEGPQQEDLFGARQFGAKPSTEQGGIFGGGMTAEITTPPISVPAQSITPNQGIPPQTVSLRTASLSDVKLWQSQGYVYVGNGPDGFGMMARPDVAPMYTAPPPQAPPAPVARPEVPSAFGPNEVPATDTVTIPTARVNSNPTVARQLEEGGYKLVENRPDGMSVFRQFITEEEGSVDYQTMWTNLKRMLGRDPTPEEVDRGMSRQAQPGESTGNIAHFTPNRSWAPEDAPWKYNTPDPDPSLPNPNDPPDIALKRRQLAALLEGRTPERGTTPVGSKLELITQLENWDTRRIRPGDLDLSDMPGPDDPRWAPERLSPEEEAALIQEGHLLPPEQSQFYPPGLMVDDDTDYGFRSFPNEGPRDADGYRILEPEIDEAIPGIDRPVPPRMGQQELPLIGGIAPRPEAEDIRALRARQLLGEDWGETRQPEQLSMEGQMKDAEILDALRREDVITPEMMDLSTYKPQEMRVPGVHEGKGGLENVALGGADPRVWDVVGSSLYARKRPVTTVKELLQNAWDEHKEIGSTQPVRVLIDNAADSPIGGPTGRSITVRDRGRGLAPENIYTYLTNLGSTGKAGVESAAGGFGFAKAAPFTGGKFTRVRSVIDMPDGARMMYTFEGRPSELKNQARGVPLHEIEVDKKIPTGLEVYTFYESDIPGFYDTAAWARNMAQRSPSVETPTLIADSYNTSKKEAREWLDETPENPITGYNYLANNNVESFSPKPVPTLQDTIKTPGADVKIHYDVPPGSEASEAKLHLTNKGMYQGSQTYNYGEMTPNVPNSIVADIIATVEEGHEAYPFSANREQLSDDVTGAIRDWVTRNIITGVTQKRVTAIQKMYDEIAPLHPVKRFTKLSYLDEGNLLTPDELYEIANHPRMVRGLQTLESIHTRMLEIADDLGWTPQTYGAKWTKPSERLKKFGILFKAPDSKGLVLGIHVPRPDDMESSAILINLMEHLNTAGKDGIDGLTSAFIVTLAHEQAHIPGGGHDKGHSYRDADLRAAFGAKNTVNWLDELEGAFGDGKGGIDPEISELLQVYNRSRERATGGTNALLATGITSTRLPNTGKGEAGDIGGTRTGEDKPRNLDGTWQSVKEATGWGQGPAGKQDPNEFNWLREALTLPSAATTTGDFSAPGRQGLSMILTPQFWKAGAAMFRGISPEGFKQIDAELKSKPIFQRKVDTETGKVSKSFAEEIGMKLFAPASNAPVGKRAEAVASRWLEQGIGTGPLSKAYAATAGVPIRATNRAFITFLNHLNANRTEFLLNKARDMSIKALDTGSARPGLFSQKYGKSEAMELNPYHNTVLAKEIADFVNTATGHGPLKTHILPFKQAEVSLEGSAKILNMALFSPGLLASRVRMLNPSTYIMASPYVRKQYMKAALSTAAAWYAFTEMAKMAGGNEVEVSNDPTSADFGKIRIGDTRMDPGGGFLQFLVQYGRMYKGGATSSASQEFKKFGEGFQAETQLSNAQRFISNKFNPVAKFAYDLANATQYNPFHVGDRMAQLFVPLVIQDINELAKEDPSLLPWMAPIALGMGTQTYSKGESVGKFIAPEDDWLVTGGGIEDLVNPQY
jgi:hypothetical protein